MGLLDVTLSRMFMANHTITLQPLYAAVSTCMDEVYHVGRSKGGMVKNARVLQQVLAHCVYGWEACHVGKNWMLIAKHTL